VHKFHETLRLISGWRPNDTVRGSTSGGRRFDRHQGVALITFWDRKNTSDESAAIGSTNFCSLEKGVDSGGADQPARAHRPQLRRIGGFNSLAQLYMQRFIEGLYFDLVRTALQGIRRFRRFINPAIEAMRFMPFHRRAAPLHRPVRRGSRRFFAEDRPALVILSSEATGRRARPFLRRAFFQPYSEAHATAGIQGSAPGVGGATGEWVMDVRRLGNFEQFHTHAALGLAAAGDKEVRVRPFGAGQLRRISQTAKGPAGVPNSESSSTRRHAPADHTLLVGRT